MPVRFKADSEYNNNFKWLESPKSTNFKPTAVQDAPTAGLTSPLQSRTEGFQMEPPIQRKKHPIPISTTSTTKMFNDDFIVPDDYILLGNQEKFSVNVPYKDMAAKNRTRVLGTTYVRPSAVPAKPSDFENESPSRMVKPAPVVHVDTGAPTKKEQALVVSSESTQTAPTMNANTQKLKKAPLGKTIVVKKAPVKTQSKLDAQKNKTVELSKKGKENVSSPPKPNIAANDEFVMKYRAGLAPARPGNKRRSEYTNEFNWKKPVQQTPLLAAEQVIHNNNPQVGPYKDNLRKSTEYQKEFKPWKFSPVKSAAEPQINQNNNNNANRNNNNNRGRMRKAKSEMNLSPDQRPPAGSPSRINHENMRLTESLNPQKPFFPHKRHVTWQSEYKTNFQPFTRYSYDNGAWKGAPPPHVVSQMNEQDAAEQTTVPVTPGTEWFSEVCELRNKAEEYRKRSRGTHFSREHAAQLMAEQSKLWDEISMSSSLSALSLEQVKPDSQRPPAGIKSVQAEKKQRNESVQAGAPSSGIANDHGTHRLAWSSDGGRSTSTSDSVRSIRSSSSLGQTASTATVTPPSTYSDSTVNGRVQTPELALSPRPVRRHHLDITTPARHGAILSNSPHKGSEERLDRSLKQLQKQAPVITATKKASNKRKSAPKRSESLQVEVADGSYIAPDDDSCNCRTSTQQQPPLSKPQSTQISPTAGRPTKDTHALLDESFCEPVDRVLETRYVSSPQPRKEHSNGLSILKEGAGQTYKIPVSQNALWQDKRRAERDDDAYSELSTSMVSVASSVSSLASEVLDRARGREKFWQQKGKGKA